MAGMTINVNGKDRTVDVSPDMPLLWVLRDTLEMTGTKFGCGLGLCGACTVHLNGAAVRSCQTTVKSAVGKTVVTIEGLNAKAEHPVQVCWRKGNVPQCGYCQSGQNHVGGSVAQAKAKTDGRGHRRRYARQYLPMRDLSTHSPGDQTGSGGEEMNRIDLVTRRTFLGGVFSAGALVLGARLFPLEAMAVSGTGAVSGADNAAWNPSVYLGIETDGTVIIVAHRSEMGTGIRTGLPTIVADELDADWARVKVEQALGDVKYGSQNTDGSCSIRDFGDAMRDAGATARMMLEGAAAAKWGVPVAECKAQNHQVVHASSNRKLGYGELASLAAQQPVPKKGELKYKPASEYRYIGKDFPTVDRDDICAGRGTFGIDAHMPGHGVCVDRAVTGVRRQAQKLRRSGS